jgi:serine/threonine protein kinase HipA of HipAB toxin-antitoxin module
MKLQWFYDSKSKKTILLLADNICNPKEYVQLAEISTNAFGCEAKATQGLLTSFGIEYEGRFKNKTNAMIFINTMVTERIHELTKAAKEMHTNFTKMIKNHKTNEV